jgi:CrcB protein
MTWLLVALGASAGAPARYLLDTALTARLGQRVPWGTLTVNLAGSLVLGVLAGLSVDDGLAALLGAGFCATFTTASTFAWEVVALTEAGHPRRAVGYLLASLLGGVGLAALGFLGASAW